MNEEDFKVEFKEHQPLDDIAKMFMEKVPVVKVGILGKKDNRLKKEQTKSGYKNAKNALFKKIYMTTGNAEIGAIHEFGLNGMPVRSFLRVPLQENLQQYLERGKAFDEEVFQELIESKSLEKWLKKLGEVAVTIVQDGFQSGGFGKWKPSNMKYKKVQMTLVETTQLRDSIIWEVE